MSWTNLEIEVQRIFFYMVTATVAGSILVIILLLLEMIPRWKNSRLKLWWIKSALLLYLIPFAVVFVIGSRVDIDIVLQQCTWSSAFLWSSTGPMQKAYILAGVIWLFGLVTGIGFRVVQYYKLKNILTGNVPVEDSLCQRLIEEYKENRPYKGAEFYQNDRIHYPITVGSIRPQIILPLKPYTEKELHMILEHEMNHVKSHDLVWKKAGLLVTFIHWWNPLVYILLGKLILQEEIECDIRTCENSNYFTMKEYGFYLSGMPEGSNDMIFASALYKSKKDLFIRLESMVRGKRYRKRTAIVSCMVLSMLAVVPSYAASEAIAIVNEKWIAETEVETEAEEVEYEVMTGTVAEDEGVAEIEVPKEDAAALLSGEVWLDYTINTNVRRLCRWQDMQAGAEVVVSAECKDSSIVYRIGIRDSEGKMEYREGSGYLNYIFRIPADGEYTVFVENRSNTSAYITGWVRYPD